jgi:hypothetical protein
MSQDLIKTGAPPRALTLTEQEARQVQEAFAVNIASGSITEFDLPRIKVNSGTALWLIPGLEGDQTAQSIEGVIVLARDTRVYYSSKDAGNVPPDCSSMDNITGSGKPGGECAKCPLAQWDSAQDGSGAQACKQTKQLFMLRGDSMFLEVVSLPPTSLKAIRQFFLMLTTQGIQYHQIIIRIDLEKAQNQQGKPYGKAAMKFVRKLSPDEAARATEFRDLALSISGRVVPGMAAE